MFKRNLKLLSIAVAVTFVLSGCKAASLNPTKESTRLTLSVFLMGGNMVVDTGTPVFTKAAEMTNISLENSLSKSTTDIQQAFGIMMASKQLPDIVAYTGREDFFQYGSEGAFIALNDLIEKHAPHIKTFLESRPDVKRFITAPDGNIYFIPFVPDGIVAEGWFIRQDWLDKLKLPVPENVEEYYNTLIAFRDRDPNGNGIKDEIPYFSRNCSPQYQDGIYDLYGIWNVRKDWFVKDGKVHFSAMEPEFRSATHNIANWYAEKLIDPEIFTRGINAREYMLGNNVGGSTHDWFGSSAAFNDSLKEKVPGFEFIAFPPLGGVEYSRRDVLTGGGWGISASNAHQVETMQYFDFWFTQQGRTLANYGVEGKQYDMVNGKPQFNDSILKGDKPVVALLNDIGAQMPIGCQQDFEYEKQWLNPIALQGISLYMDHHYIGENFPPVTYTIEENKRYNELMTPIRMFRDEMVRRWVLGNSAISTDYDQYLIKMKEMNVDELVAIVQRAYDRYTQK